MNLTDDIQMNTRKLNGTPITLELFSLKGDLLTLI
jgi:hypothetical protein